MSARTGRLRQGRSRPFTYEPFTCADTAGLKTPPTVLPKSDHVGLPPPIRAETGPGDGPRETQRVLYLNKRRTSPKPAQGARPETCSRDPLAANGPMWGSAPAGTHAGSTRRPSPLLCHRHPTGTDSPWAWPSEGTEDRLSTLGYSTPEGGEGCPSPACLARAQGGPSQGSRLSGKHVGGNVPLPCHGSPCARNGRLPNAAEPPRPPPICRPRRPTRAAGRS
jgi:hypothetical protein